MPDKTNTINTVLNETQFAALHDTDPGSPAATKVLEEIGATGLSNEVTLRMVDDGLGNHTAQYVSLSLHGQGDILSPDTAQEIGMPTASEAVQNLASQQADILAQNDPATALRILNDKPGQAGSR